jgi:hypothetical protein
MLITLNKQIVSKECDTCRISFTVVRGQVMNEGQPLGLYLAALHGDSPDGRLAHLAIAVLSPSHAMPQAAAIKAISMPYQFGFVFVDWAESPWASEVYLGQFLDRQDALSSDCRDTFLHIAEHVTSDLPEVREYLQSEGRGPRKIT